MSQQISEKIGVPLMVFNPDSIYIGQVKGYFTKQQYQDIDDCMSVYWKEWKEQVKQPDSDSQFIGWLIENKGFQEYWTDIVSTQITE